MDCASEEDGTREGGKARGKPEWTRWVRDEDILAQDRGGAGGAEEVQSAALRTPWYLLEEWASEKMRKS